MPKIDLTSFKKAIDSLEVVILELNKNPNEFVKTAAIQRFEYTYELSHKMLKRVLLQQLPNKTEVKEMFFPDLIRTASQHGLVMSDWSVWYEYREMRNLTSHTYNEDKAAEVLAIVPKFYHEAKFLYNKLLDIDICQRD